ncbi:hypothetical protein PCANC_16348 [Puccinia coronata f. sp. avenae]|uniref:Uncharacterized protein n=1 Tax=Puccinia coronata f. sp. avenae TaxID=200324 RepID=A0A2N5UQN5_9BASI|nr:hypothetical protein PCANC_16348 [Puccinia coronata f. sp. avenae]
MANNGHHESADPHDDRDKPSGECNSNLYESVDPPTKGYIGHWEKDLVISGVGAGYAGYGPRARDIQTRLPGWKPY